MAVVHGSVTVATVSVSVATSGLGNKAIGLVLMTEEEALIGEAEVLFLYTAAVENVDACVVLVVVTSDRVGMPYETGEE